MRIQAHKPIRQVMKKQIISITMVAALSSPALGMGARELNEAASQGRQLAQTQEQAQRQGQTQAQQQGAAQVAEAPAPAQEQIQAQEPAQAPVAASEAVQQPKDVSQLGQSKRSHFSLDSLFPPVNKNMIRMGLQVAFGVADAAAIIKLRSLNWQTKARIRGIKTAKMLEQDELMAIIQEYERLEQELKNVNQLLTEKEAAIRTLENEDVEILKRVNELENEVAQLSRKRRQTEAVQQKISALAAQRQQLYGRIDYIRSNPQEVYNNNRLQATLLRDRNADLLTKRAEITTKLKSLKPKYKMALIPMQTFRGPAVRIAANKTLSYVFKAGMLLCVLDVGGRLFIWNALDRNPGFLPLVRVGYAGYKTAYDVVQGVSDATLNILK